MHATIKAIIPHWQEYQHQYSREEKPNSLVNIAGKPRVRITIIKEVAVGTNIARITLLATTRRNNPKPI
jgi:type IV secretory pathway component VirB8